VFFPLNRAAIHKSSDTSRENSDAHFVYRCIAIKGSVLAIRPDEEAASQSISGRPATASPKSMATTASVLYNCCRVHNPISWILVPTFRHPSTLPFQPPHSANRHDAGWRGAGADRVVSMSRGRTATRRVLERSADKRWFLAQCQVFTSIRDVLCDPPRREHTRRSELAPPPWIAGRRKAAPGQLAEEDAPAILPGRCAAGRALNDVVGSVDAPLS
jgi:hypothetical protein